MFKNDDSRKEPVKWGVQFGLIYGFTYALDWFNFGYISFFVSVGLGVFYKMVSKE